MLIEIIWRIKLSKTQKWDLPSSNNLVMVNLFSIQNLTRSLHNFYFEAFIRGVSGVLWVIPLFFAGKLNLQQDI